MTTNPAPTPEVVDEQEANSDKKYQALYNEIAWPLKAWMVVSPTHQKLFSLRDNTGDVMFLETKDRVEIFETAQFINYLYKVINGQKLALASEENAGAELAMKCDALQIRIDELQALLDEEAAEELEAAKTEMVGQVKKDPTEHSDALQGPSSNEAGTNSSTGHVTAHLATLTNDCYHAHSNHTEISFEVCGFNNDNGALSAQYMSDIQMLLGIGHILKHRPPRGVNYRYHEGPAAERQFAIVATCPYCSLTPVQMIDERKTSA